MNNKLSPTAKGLIVAIVLLLMHVFIVMPLHERTQSVSSDIRSLQKRVERIRALRNNSESYEKNEDRINKGDFISNAEDDAVKAQFIKEIESSAEAGSVVITDIKPDDVHIENGLRIVPFSVSLKGDMSGFTKFLYSFYEQHKPVLCTDIQIRADKSEQSKNTLNIELRLEKRLLL